MLEPALSASSGESGAVSGLDCLNEGLSAVFPDSITRFYLSGRAS